jgi:hypothetical protein
MPLSVSVLSLVLKFISCDGEWELLVSARKLSSPEVVGKVRSRRNLYCHVTLTSETGMPLVAFFLCCSEDSLISVFGDGEAKSGCLVSRLVCDAGNIR